MYSADDDRVSLFSAIVLSMQGKGSEAGVMSARMTAGNPAVGLSSAHAADTTIGSFREVTDRYSFIFLSL